MPAALQHHPDRNIGKELEAQIRFQDIQAAHEILLDPEKRSRYDADRAKAGLFASFNKPEVPPRSPRTTGTTAWPPPPRRTQPQPAPFANVPKGAAANGIPRTRNPPPTMGADRYSAYTATRQGDTQQGPWMGPAGDQRSNLNAWAQMKKHPPGRNDRTKPGPFQAPPPKRAAKQYADGKTGKQRGGWDTDTPPRPAPAPAPAPESRKPFPERPAAGPGMQRANTTRNPQRPGFYTGVGGGDEPPARNASTYYNMRPQAARPQSSFHPQPPPKFGASEKKRPEPVNIFKTKSQGEDPFNSDRLSTPYATAGGERTYFNSEGMNRSSSQSSNLHAGWNASSARTSPRSPDTRANSTRHRSASPQFRSPHPQDELSSSSSSCSSDSDPEVERQKLNPKGQSRRHAGSSQPDQRPHPEYPSVTVEEDDAEPGPARPKHRSTWSEETGTPKVSQQFSASQPASRKGSAGDIPQGFAGSRTSNPSAQPPPSPLSAQPPWSNDTSSRPIEKSKSWQESFGSTKDGNNRFERPKTGEETDKRPGYGPYHFSMRAHAHPISSNPTLFSLGTGQRMHIPSSRRPSWPYWAIPSSLGPNGQKLEPTNHARPSVLGTCDDPFGGVIADRSKISFFFPTDSSASASPRRESSTENKHASFSSEEWKNKFATDNAHEYLGPQQPAKTAPRGRSPPKRTNGQNIFAKSTNGEGPQESTIKPASTDVPVPPPDPSAAKFSKEDWSKYFKESNWANPSPEKPAVAGINKRSKTPRKMSTANRRPNLTPKGPTVSTAEEEAAATLSNSSSSSAMDIDSKNTPPAQPNMAQKNVDPIADIIRGAVPRNGQPAPAAEDETMNLKDLKKTAPFTPSNANGLGDLNDLGNTLPFESQPSASIPGQTVSPQRLDLPKIPQAPTAPDPDQLTTEKWFGYTNRFHQYLQQWNMYHQRMLLHFTERAKREAELRPDIYTPAANKEFQEYVRGVEEDFRVREHWELSCEMHRDAMKALAGLRVVAARDGLNEEY